jgi:hypothetical protein
MFYIKQNESIAARRRIAVLLTDITNGYTPETGVSSPTINISKNGNTTFSGAGVWTEIGSGQYYYELTSSECDTLGWISLNINKATVSRDFNAVIHCVAYDAYASTNLGLSNIDTTISSRMATFTLPSNFSSLAINGSGGMTVGTNNDKTISSSITISPGSTSQSIEIYLGLTGMTYQTSGLQAYYVRNRSVPVQIALVSQTATGAWASGGFAEIDSTNMPGIYRLDVPNAAFASGSSDVTIHVRGVTGGDEFMMTVNLAYTQIDMTQSVPTSNTAHTLGDALNAARAYGFGKWVISGTTLSLYASDNTTVIKTFTLDSGSYPTSRT